MMLIDPMIDEAPALRARGALLELGGHQTETFANADLIVLRGTVIKVLRAFRRAAPGKRKDQQVIAAKAFANMMRLSVRVYTIRFT